MFYHTEKVSRAIEHDFSPVKYETAVSQDREQKTKNMDILVNLIKDKLIVTMTRREQIQLFTLVPNS